VAAEQLRRDVLFAEGSEEGEARFALLSALSSEILGIQHDLGDLNQTDDSEPSDFSLFSANWGV